MQKSLKECCLRANSRHRHFAVQVAESEIAHALETPSIRFHFVEETSAAVVAAEVVSAAALRSWRAGQNTDFPVAGFMVGEMLSIVAEI